MKAAIIANDRRPGDVLVFGDHAAPADPPLSRETSLPASDVPPDALVTRTATQIGQLHVEECQDTARCLANADRVWLVTSYPANGVFPLDVKNSKMQYLRDAFIVVHAWQLGRGTLTLLAARTRAATERIDRASRGRAQPWTSAPNSCDITGACGAMRPVVLHRDVCRPDVRGVAAARPAPRTGSIGAGPGQPERRAGGVRPTDAGRTRLGLSGGRSRALGAFVRLRHRSTAFACRWSPRDGRAEAIDLAVSTRDRACSVRRHRERRTEDSVGRGVEMTFTDSAGNRWIRISRAWAPGAPSG
jgi:hypothetical protein